MVNQLYRVRAGESLAHDGVVLTEGATVSLPRELARDVAVAGRVQRIDHSGCVIDDPAPDDLERFRAHERVAILRERLADAMAEVLALEARIKAEDAALAQYVADASAAQSEIEQLDTEERA